MTVNSKLFKSLTAKQVKSLTKLSTERLIIWIIGRNNELGIKLSIEDIVIECWAINPEKHSLRGHAQYPDSHNVIKRIYEMKGKKGLLTGSPMTGFYLSDISQLIYADISELLKQEKIKLSKGLTAADRSISSLDEAPYKRLKKTPAYVKFKEEKISEIVETDFLYFYGVNWHSKRSYIQNRIKNVDTVVKIFADRDEILKKVHKYLNEKFGYIKLEILKNK